MRRLLIPILVVLIGGATLWLRQTEPGAPAPVEASAQGEARSSLPAEGWAALALIERGGPFPYRQDGSVFQNREGLLPEEARGYYHEYTVPTPGARDRGARRIIAGGTPPSVWYYTDDHYKSFRPFSPVENSGS
jgi:ribonuclease T1